jgi:N-acetylmuramoyl-L-alanine amidase/putative methionine-R-sulfoxide reductase with GAF domain
LQPLNLNRNLKRQEFYACFGPTTPQTAVCSEVGNLNPQALPKTMANRSCPSHCNWHETRLTYSYTRQKPDRNGHWVEFGKRLATQSGQLTMTRLDGHTRDEDRSFTAIAMATTPTKLTIEAAGALIEAPAPSWPRSASAGHGASNQSPAYQIPYADEALLPRPSGRDALQALLAFSALHQQIRQRRALASRRNGFDTIACTAEFEPPEQFVLDEVLQLVAERAIAITGADGLGIALAENNEIVLRASAGAIKPDVGARIQRDSAFSGACFRTAQIIRCDDTETDDRVNLYACRQLGARSMVAVPLCGRRRVIGLLEAFSAEPFGFNDSDVGSLELLAELILGALKPEDEDRFAESAQVAEANLDAPPIPQPPPPIVVSTSEKVSATLELTPLVEDAPSTSAAVAEPTPALDVPTLSPEPDKILEPAPAIEVSPELSPAHRPGIVLVLVLVVICSLLASGLWWKLKNAQLGQVMIQPEPKMVTKPQSPALPHSSSLAPASSTGTDAPSNSVVTSAAAPALDAPSDSSSESATPQSPSKLARITGIRHWSSADSSTVVLDLEDQVQYEAHRLANPDRIYFDLHDTALAPELFGKTIDVGDSLLARVRVAQPVAGLTRVVLETKGNSDFSVSLEPNPYRLVVQVRKLGANTKSQVNLFPGATEAEREKMPIVVPPPAREDVQLRARVPKMRIVVDAGHGGWDLGTVGRRGLLEKDLVLEIAQRLGKLLESRLGADVVLTRNNDNYVPLDERAGMANQAQADLFVSVHANYSDLPSARGVETYYTNFFTAPNAKDKDLDTRAAKIDSKTPAVTLSPADLHEKIEQSRRLAASVQRSLYGTLSAENPGLRDRGVKEASYVVLTETAMPGILAEVSFVSSPTDEQKLRNDGYREQIAEALYKGIARYAASSHGVKMASAAK